MQTITTKYINPTATSGAKIKATSTGGESVTVPYDYSNENKGHLTAAKKLKDKLGWKGTMHGGHIKGGFVFVFSDPELQVNPVPPLKSKRKAAKGKTKILRNPIVENFKTLPFENSFQTLKYKDQYIQLSANGNKNIAKVLHTNGLKFQGSLTGAKKFIRDNLAKSNPVKKGLTARPRKASNSSMSYVVELRHTKNGAWEGKGIFPSKDLASQYAEALHDQYGGKCYVRVTV